MIQTVVDFVCVSILIGLAMVGLVCVRRQRKERRDIKHNTRLRVEYIATFILFSTAMMLGMHIVARTTAVTELLRLLVVPIAFAYIFGVMWVAPWAYDRSCREARG